MQTLHLHTATIKPVEPPVAPFPSAGPLKPFTVTVRRLGPPLPRMLPTFPSAEAVRGEVRLSRGAVCLWALLHRLACDVARQRE